MAKKSQLASTIEYWTRQAQRLLMLIISIVLLVLAAIAGFWLIRTVWNTLMG